ncbi:MAG: hypothetical protein ACLUGY_24965 [Phocaeicola massiliensis]
MHTGGHSFGQHPGARDGYCAGQTSDEENRRMAAVRSSQMKSELIGRAGVTETCSDRQPCRGVRRRSAECSDRDAVHPADINETKDLPDAADT